jgi:exopolysaccharide biosynthesis WecB/TagA/CpsF family protein
MTVNAEKSQKWLVVKLADIGDLLTITPALHRLREAQPDSVIHVLTTAHSAPILSREIVDDVILFDKFAFDHPRDALRPVNVRLGVELARRLRMERYDAVLILHHLTTRFGAAKYAALALATGASRRIGLNNGRGWFFTEQVPDAGFGALHEVQYWLQVIDIALNRKPAQAYSPNDSQMHIVTTAEDRAWAEAHLPEPASGPRIAIHSGSGGYSLARRWAPDAFARVADALETDAGAQIILVGRPDDNVDEVISAMQHAPINLAGKTTLGQLAAVLQTCELFIGADSGVMHIAAAAGTKTLAIFGPSNANAWGPWSEHAVALRSNPVCSPCSYIRNTVGQREGCAAHTCMKLVTSEDVMEAAVRMLDNDPGSQPLPYYSHVDNDPMSRRISMLGIPLDPLSWQDLHSRLSEWMDGDTPHQICTVNPEFVMVAQQDIIFYNILNRVGLCVADGQGLLWAARYLGFSLPDRITGSDGVPFIAEWAAEAGWKLFLLGAADGVAARAADILHAHYPGLQIVGTFPGSPSPEEEAAIVDMINTSGADILFVAYGAPAQDKWIARNLPRLRVKAAMGIGGTLDFIVGVQKRAPESWQRLGLEWLYRLIQEPWRWKRMTRLPRFVLAVLWRRSKGPSRFVA